MVALFKQSCFDIGFFEVELVHCKWCVLRIDNVIEVMLVLQSQH